MNRIPKQLFQSLSIIMAGLGVGLIAYQLKNNPPRLSIPQPVPTPSWQEQPIILTDREQATMSGDFTQEFQQALEEEKTPPKPSSIVILDTLASMAGDIVAPKVTISGEPPCFSLWVSDNMTPWKQLVTRTKLDNGQWSPWMNYFSYCFDNLGNGSHTVRIQIKDLAGNVSSEVKRTFIVKR